jgi:hypothetical protein
VRGRVPPFAWIRSYGFLDSAALGTGQLGRFDACARVSAPIFFTSLAAVLHMARGGLREGERR